ncbi:MAG: PEP-CTERM sorting domain-containing protein [Pirellulales bacterium]
MRQVLRVSMVAFVCVSLGTARAYAAPFRNLDFEASEVREWQPSLITPWMADLTPDYRPEGVPLNEVALDSVNISLIDSTSRGMKPIEGGYSLMLQGGLSNFLGAIVYRDASISQTGDVPANAQSLRVLVHRTLGSFWQVSLDGSDIPMFPLKEIGQDVWEYGGDIRSFAGSTSQLVLGTREHWENTTLFDAITFSPEPVPEPASIILAILGFAGLVALGRVTRRLKS